MNSSSSQLCVTFGFCLRNIMLGRFVLNFSLASSMTNEKSKHSISRKDAFRLSEHHTLCLKDAPNQHETGIPHIQ
jgi:hypothetical protein